MAAWCAENLRDIEGWRASGLSVTASSNEECKLLDAAIRQLVSWRDCDQFGGLFKTFESLSKADPDNALATSFMCFTSEAKGPGKEVVERTEKLSESPTINERERKHLKAAALFARGDTLKAEYVWDSILDEYPNDLMAVKFLNESYFFSGNAQGKRDSLAKVLPKWKKDEPCYSFLHGMYAFGLEECAEFEKAEEHAITALTLRPEDTWAIHARAHIFEMQGRTKEGKAFMEGTRANWENAWLATHHHWHNTLFYVDDGDFKTALTMYDNEVGRRANASAFMMEFSDAASLLWRLELQGVDVGERWKSLHHDVHAQDSALSFGDAHFAMCARRGGFIEKERELHESLVNFVKTGPHTNSRVVAEEVGLPLYEGIVAFTEQDYDKTIRLLLPIKENIHKIGGSVAQDDIFHQTLIVACLNAGNAEHTELGKRLIMERNDSMPNSGMIQRLTKRYE